MSFKNLHTISGNIVVYLLFFASASFLWGCKQGIVYDDTRSFKNKEWNVEDVPEFKVNIDDTISRFDFLVNFRHNNDYPYSNLFLFIHTYYPQGEVTHDTVEFLLALPSGEWLGDGFGKLITDRILLRENMIFPQKGEYVFRFEQAMRAETLEGVEDFGITIKKRQDN